MRRLAWTCRAMKSGGTQADAVESGTGGVERERRVCVRGAGLQWRLGGQENLIADAIRRSLTRLQRGGECH